MWIPSINNKQLYIVENAFFNCILKSLTLENTVTVKHNRE